MIDIMSYILGQKSAESGGGDITVEPLTVTENRTYTAEEEKAFNPVVVSVPNSYTAGDEGKVVSNGALVAQTSDTVTQNGTVDTTLINSLLVAIPGLQTETVATLAEEMTLKDFLTANPIPLKYKSGIVFLFNNSDNAPTQGAGTTGWSAFGYYDESHKLGMLAAYTTNLTAPNLVAWNTVTSSAGSYFSISNGAITASSNTNATRYIPAGTVMVRADIPLNLDTRTFDYTEV